jgi:endonuclease/exonuclease/phosphatase family metal-dependent hydrolase
MINFKLRSLTGVFIYILVFLTSCLPGHVQDNNTNFEKQFERIVFYNVENLFDPENDSLKNDDEFTPEGGRNWNQQRFYTKINHIYQVIIGVGEWNPPAVVGLCEVENRWVLNRLVYQTPLKTFDYKIIHEESPDNRGIDVAMIYRSTHFTPLSHHNIPVGFPFDSSSKTRDILYVKGYLHNMDTVHLFVNHWPSRYGGHLETDPKREHAALILRIYLDSLNSEYDKPNIILMGDFNDEPEDKSMKEVLVANLDSISLMDYDFFNLMGNYRDDPNTGTVKYQQSWMTIDQIIVSANLVKGNQPLQISRDGGRIYSPDFLLEEDFKYLGIKPFRTYIGYTYNAGFSDHLPVYVDLILKISP